MVATCCLSIATFNLKGFLAHHVVDSGDELVVTTVCIWGIGVNSLCEPLCEVQVGNHSNTTDAQAAANTGSVSRIYTRLRLCSGSTTLLLSRAGQPFEHAIHSKARIPPCWLKTASCFVSRAATYSFDQ
jgi:hypothetical protein